VARALEVDFPSEKQLENLYVLETTGEIFQKLFSEKEVDLDHIAEVKRVMGIKPAASPCTCLAEVYAIGSDQEEKTSPHLSCKVNGIQCKTLCDIRAQVCLLSSKIYDEIHDHTIYIVLTSTKLIMGDGRIVRPLGVACNLKVIISEKCTPTDFFIIDAYYDEHDHIILSSPFLNG
jgi:hypothetical protein